MKDQIKNKAAQQSGQPQNQKPGAEINKPGLPPCPPDYKTLIDKLDDVTYALDTNSDICYVSPQIQNYGYTPQELIGISLLDLIHPDDKQRIAALLCRTLVEGFETPHIEPVELRMLTGEGQVRWIEERGFPVRDHTGKITGLTGIVRDVSERKKAEQALRQSEEKYRLLFKNAGQAVLTINHAGVLLLLNENAAHQMGGRPEDFLGKTLWELFPKDVADYQIGIVQQAIRSGQVQVLESEREVGGMRRCYVTHIQPVTGLDGNTTQIQCIAYDITELRRIRREHEELQAQLAQTQKMEAVGRLTAGVAHDFNNLLMVINGYAEHVQSSLSHNDPLYQPLAKISKAGWRAAELVRQLMVFSRQQVLQLSVVDLNQIVNIIHPKLGQIIGPNIQLQIDLDPVLWPVRTDPTQLERMIVNMAANARDAMPEGGTLTIQTANVVLDQAYSNRRLEVMPGEYVRLSICDTGTGMNDEVKSHIFEPFFTTKPTGKSTGLGLSLAYGVIKQSQGHIDVESQVGQGTQFIFYLPRAH